jgi:hypothetical protein
MNIIKKIIEDKKEILDHIANGGKFVDLKDKFNLAKPIPIKSNNEKEDMKNLNGFNDGLHRSSGIGGKIINIFKVDDKIEELSNESLKEIHEHTTLCATENEEHIFLVGFNEGFNKQEWTDKKVIDFVNWYIKLKKLPINYELENLHIIESFKKGDDVSLWEEKL